MLSLSSRNKNGRTLNTFLMSATNSGIRDILIDSKALGHFTSSWVLGSIKELKLVRLPWCDFLLSSSSESSGNVESLFLKEMLELVFRDTRSFSTHWPKDIPNTKPQLPVSERKKSRISGVSFQLRDVLQTTLRITLCVRTGAQGRFQFDRHIIITIAWAVTDRLSRCAAANTRPGQALQTTHIYRGGSESPPCLTTSTYLCPFLGSCRRSWWWWLSSSANVVFAWAWIRWRNPLPLGKKRKI